MLKRIIDNIRRNYIYVTTLSELSNLTEYQLKDIGLNRSMISSYAYDIAYGKEDRNA